MLATCVMPDGRLKIYEPHAAGNAAQHHCIDCPALRSDCLHGLIGQSSAECRFETLTIEARAPFALPVRLPYRLGLVRRGVLLRERPGPAGRRVAIDVVGAGDAFYLDPKLTTSISGEGEQACVGYAATRTLLCLCPDAALSDGMQQAQLALELHELGLRALSRLERLSEARGVGDATARIAALLCVLADTMGAHLPAGFQQRDLARISSLRHESVCRALRQLGERGLVQHGPNGIHIIDRAALAAFG